MKISWGQNHLQFSYLVWGEERGVFGVIFSVSFIAGLGHKLSDIDTVYRDGKQVLLSQP